MAVVNKTKMNVYFFTNGKPYMPLYKVCTNNRELQCDGFVQRVQRLYLYKGYIVYTMFGQLMKNKTQVHDNAAFVLVNRADCFIPAPYSNVFRETLKLPDLDKNCKCKISKKRKKKVENVCACQNIPYSELRKLKFVAGCHHMGMNIHCTDIVKKSKKRQPYELCPCASNCHRPPVECVAVCSDVPTQPCPTYHTKKSGCFGRKKKERKPVYHIKKQPCGRTTVSRTGTQTFKSEADLRASSQRLAYGCQVGTIKTKKKGTGCCGKKRKKPKPAWLEKKYLKYKKEKERRLRKECRQKLKDEEDKKKKKKKRSNSCCSCCSCNKPKPVWRRPAPKNVSRELHQAECTGRRRRIEAECSREDPFLREKVKISMCASQTCPAELRGGKCKKKKKKKKKKSAGCFG